MSKIQQIFCATAAMDIKPINWIKVGKNNNPCVKILLKNFVGMFVCVSIDLLNAETH